MGLGLSPTRRLEKVKCSQNPMYLCITLKLEKESLVITWACAKFDYYLVGHEFQTETDQSPMVKLLGVKGLGSLSLRASSSVDALSTVKTSAFDSLLKQMLTAKDA